MHGAEEMPDANILAPESFSSSPHERGEVGVMVAEGCRFINADRSPTNSVQSLARST
jgi:hypothetical protein